MSFLKLAVLPRWRAILVHKNLWISAVFGILVWISLTFLSIPPIAQSVLVRDATPLVVAFTSMGFGVSITAVALVLALPLNRAVGLTIVNSVGGEPVGIVKVSERLIARNPTTGVVYEKIPGNRSQTGYLNLVFTFVWTAMANVWAALAAIVATVLNGNSELLTSGFTFGHLLTAIVAAFLVYATMQLFSALLTVYQVAKLFQSFSILEIEENGRNGSVSGDSV
ncbi:hypothetical protein [Arthrobacter sp. 35W]|uniref:hypothetical protein n=1 Tax=Arthrobacter sp. 35W TaxID=1132441 RepID=UPI0012DD78C1|nr:hypothetical protein [Arthrobacter sp. 35W]